MERGQNTCIQSQHTQSRIEGMSRPQTAMQRPPSQAGRGPARQGSAMGNRAPRTAINRPSTAMGGGAPQRMGTAAARSGRIGTAAPPKTGMARPGSRMGGTGTIPARPMTMQGVEGVRPQTKGLMGRQVMDRSYYMGLLRQKYNQLNEEIGRLERDVEHYGKERENFLVYEKKAEVLAAELKTMQGQLADYNMVVDKMHTNTDVSDVKIEYEQLKEQNENESQTVDSLFADRRHKEDAAKKMEVELEEARRQAEGMLTNMDEEVRERYESLKEENETLTENLREKQNELDELVSKKSALEDELAVSQIKQEAMMLHEKLSEVEGKRDAILEEINAEGTPEQKRERLLERVKRDNEEIVTMEKQTNEVREKIEQCREELRELDDEMEDQQGEKNQKYRELKMKEQQIDDFLQNFEATKRDEMTRVASLQRNVVKNLKGISKNVTALDKTISVVGGMEDYDLGSVGKKKVDRNSVPELQKEHERLEEELMKLDEMEEKAREEMGTLKEKIEEMKDEMDTFGDIESLRHQAADKQRSLEREQEELESKVEASRERMNQIRQEVDQIKRQLNENDTYIQITNLEKKLQYIEQTNFAIREVVDARAAETNVAPIKAQVTSMLAECSAVLSANAGRNSSVLGSA